MLIYILSIADISLLLKVFDSPRGERFVTQKNRLTKRFFLKLECDPTYCNLEHLYSRIEKVAECIGCIKQKFINISC